MLKLSRVLLALLCASSVPAQADWHLDGESSRLSFIASQNGDTSLVHRFLVLHGKVDDAGAAQLRIEADSVFSGVPLRDERIRDALLEVKQYPDITVQTRIDLRPIQDLANGAQVELRLPLTVTVRGRQHRYEAPLLATRLDQRRFQVVTLEPVVLHAEDFGLVPGLDALRKLAGVTSISPSVPVNAVLIFNAR